MKCNLAVLGAFLLPLAPLARAAYVTEVLADNPVGYWRFEDANTANGNTALNWGTTGATNHGTYQGGVTAATSYGLLGNAASFNGASAYVDLGFNMRDALHGATAVTVEAWVKNDTLPPNSSTSYFIYRTVINGTDTGARLAINFADPRMNLGGARPNG